VAAVQVPTPAHAHTISALSSHAVTTDRSVQQSPVATNVATSTVPVPTFSSDTIDTANVDSELDRTGNFQMRTDDNGQTRAPTQVDLARLAVDECSRLLAIANDDPQCDNITLNILRRRLEAARDHHLYAIRIQATTAEAARQSRTAGSTGSKSSTESDMGDYDDSASRHGVDIDVRHGDNKPRPRPQITQLQSVLHWVMLLVTQ
jgi:hypothetical protein